MRDLFGLHFDLVLCLNTQKPGHQPFSIKIILKRLKTPTRRKRPLALVNSKAWVDSKDRLTMQFYPYLRFMAQPNSDMV